MTTWNIKMEIILEKRIKIEINEEKNFPIFYLP